MQGWEKKSAFKNYFYLFIIYYKLFIILVSKITKVSWNVSI